MRYRGRYGVFKRFCATVKIGKTDFDGAPKTLPLRRLSTASFAVKAESRCAYLAASAEVLAHLNDHIVCSAGISFPKACKTGQPASRVTNFKDPAFGSELYIWNVLHYSSRMALIYRTTRGALSDKMQVIYYAPFIRAGVRVHIVTGAMRM